MNLRSTIQKNIEEAFESLARKGYDPNQPRAKDGKWTAAGSGSGGGKEGIDLAGRVDMEPPDFKDFREAFGRKGNITAEIEFAQSMQGLIPEGLGNAIENKMQVERQLQERLKDNEDWKYFAKHSSSAMGPYSPEGNAVALWAKTSADEHEHALFMQEMAMKEFGLDASTGHFDPSYTSGLRDRWQNRMGLDIDRMESGARGFLREMYNETQAHFEEKGITELTLVRGSTFTKERIRDSKLEMSETEHRSYDTGLDVQKAEVSFGYGDVGLQPMSSWSTDFPTAVGFSNQGSGNVRGVIVARVSAKNILSYPKSGFGCTEEYEAVVLGGDRTSRTMFVKTSGGGTEGFKQGRPLIQAFREDFQKEIKRLPSYEYTRRWKGPDGEWRYEYDND